MPKKLLTITAFAKEMGVSRPRIAKLVKEGILPINRNKLIDAEEAAKIMTDRRKLDDALPMSKTLSDARIRVESLRAGMIELEFRQKKGELIEREKVMHMITGIIAIAKTKLLSIPTKVAPLIVGSDSIKKIKSIIEKEIRFALEELARMKEIK